MIYYVHNNYIFIKMSGLTKKYDIFSILQC